MGSVGAYRHCSSGIRIAMFERDGVANRFRCIRGKEILLATRVCRQCGASFWSGRSYADRDYCRSCSAIGGLGQNNVNELRIAHASPNASGHGRMEQSGGHPAIVLIAGAVTMVGFFLPWLSFGPAALHMSVSGDEIAKTLDSYWLVFGGGLAAVLFAGFYIAKTIRDARVAVAVSGWVPLMFLVIKITRALTGAGIEGLAVSSSGMRLGLGVFLSAGGLLAVALSASRLRSYVVAEATVVHNTFAEVTSQVADPGNAATETAPHDRYCGHCGRAARADNAFCTGCGHKVG